MNGHVAERLADGGDLGLLLGVHEPEVPREQEGVVKEGREGQEAVLVRQAGEVDEGVHDLIGKIEAGPGLSRERGMLLRELLERVLERQPFQDEALGGQDGVEAAEPDLEGVLGLADLQVDDQVLRALVLVEDLESLKGILPGIQLVVQGPEPSASGRPGGSSSSS